METINSVKEYYGKKLKSGNDLQTNACCVGSRAPKEIREVLDHVHEEIKNRFYGCGSPIPTNIEGKTILDLGCGTGRDCYVLSKLVGESGTVIGIDMTEEQLEVAKRHIDYHTDKFRYKKPNVKFIQGYIEDLASAQIASSSVDVVISNCVINLSPDKEKVFSEIFRVLKPGGELLFSDVFASRRIPKDLKDDHVLFGECLSGALYIEDFRRILSKIGVNDFRVVSSSPITVNNKEIEERLGMIEFQSLTIRAFKLDLEDRCEDYGQIATYVGPLASFKLDDHHIFEAYKSVSVCRNTALMLSETRYSNQFKVTGSGDRHFGLFNCAPKVPTKNKNDSGACC